MSLKKSRVKITVEALPPSLNKWQRWHWRDRQSIKKWWEREITAWILTQPRNSRFRKVNGLIRRAKVTITYYFRTRHWRDPDNFPPKCIMDALKGQIIEDDRADLITLQVAPHNYSKNNARTEIEIEPFNTPST